VHRRSLADAARLSTVVIVEFRPNRVSSIF
jgi:hypothetical protein